MPAHQRIGGDERGDGVERPSSEEPGLRRQSTTLIVSQPELPATKLLFEDPVLLDQVGDNVLLMPMHPARNRQQEQLERESSGRHSAIVGALNSHAHRQLRTDPFFAQGGVKALGRRRWKKASGYHQQARVENAFFRYKSIVGDCLRARSSSGQRREAVLACNVLNRMTELGRPVSYRIGR